MFLLWTFQLVRVAAQCDIYHYLMNIHYFPGGSDYVTRLISPLNFEPTTDRTQCQQIFTSSDFIYEIDEVFEILLSTSSTNQITLLPRRARITIIDDDSKFLTCAHTLRQSDSSSHDHLSYLPHSRVCELRLKICY